MKNRKFRIITREMIYHPAVIFVVQIKYRLFFSIYWFDYGKACETIEEAKELINEAKNPVPLFKDKEVYNDK